MPGLWRFGGCVVTLRTASTTELATEFNVTKGRVSQWVAEGKLNGCYEGDGRDRRFDVAKCAAALGMNRDLGQSIGNGMDVTRRIAAINAAGEPGEIDLGELEENPPDDEPQAWVDLAAKARVITERERAREALRKSAAAAGRFVLKSEVAAAVSGQISRLIGEIERTFFREVAAALADELGIETAQAKAILQRTWREHRATAASNAMDEAEAAGPSEAEEAVERELNAGLA